MPELPEVHTICSGLVKAGITGSVILSASVFWPKMVAPLKPFEFKRRVSGRGIQAVERRGKYIKFRLDNSTFLLIHLRMTGRLDLVRAGVKRDKHQHVIFSLDQKRELRFHDTRKFGRILHTAQPEQILAQLGPEPLDKALTSGIFYTRLKQHKRRLKPLLLDQGFIAGLGNIYVDESLWTAHLHPLKTSHTITRQEAGRLLKAIRKVLNQAITNLGTSLGDGETNFVSAFGRGRNRDKLAVFRRKGQACPRCGESIKHQKVGQRSTYICPACQRET
jgi:formamidopyrimidine-DNA glycosylase